MVSSYCIRSAACDQSGIFAGQIVCYELLGPSLPLLASYKLLNVSWERLLVFGFGVFKSERLPGEAVIEKLSCLICGIFF